MYEIHLTSVSLKNIWLAMFRQISKRVFIIAAAFKKKSDQMAHKENMKIQFSSCSLLICIDILSQWQSTFPFWASDNFSVF